MAAYQEETWEFDANGDPTRVHREEHSFEGGTARTRHVIQDFSEQDELELLKALIPEFAKYQTRRLELDKEERQNRRDHQIQRHYAMLAGRRFQLEVQQEAAEQQRREWEFHLEQRRTALQEQRAAIEAARARVEARRANNEAQRLANEERDSERQFELDYQRLAEEQRQARKSEEQQDVKLQMLRNLISMAIDPTVPEDTRNAIQSILAKRGIDTSELTSPEGGP